MRKVSQIFILFCFSRCRNTKILSKQRNQKSKFFPRKHSLDNPKRVFSSFGLSERVFNFLLFFSSCRNELSARKVPKSRSRFQVVKPHFHKFQSLYVTVEMIKVELFSLENLRGIVRQTKVRKSTNSVVTDLSERVTERTVRQRFFTPQVCLFIFLL